MAWIRTVGSRLLKETFNHSWSRYNKWEGSYTLVDNASASGSISYSLIPTSGYFTKNNLIITKADGTSSTIPLTNNTLPLTNFVKGDTLVANWYMDWSNQTNSCVMDGYVITQY